MITQFHARKTPNLLRTLPNRHPEKENYSNRQVADKPGLRAADHKQRNQTRTVTQLNRQNQNGKVYDYYHDVYDADAGQAAYEKNRLNCGRRPLWADTDAFIEWADDMMLLEKWSPDVVVGFARKHELFDPAIILGPPPSISGSTVAS